MTLRIPVQQKRFVRGREAPDAERSIKALGRTIGLTRFASRSEKRVLMFLTTARPPRPDTRMEDWRLHKRGLVVCRIRSEQRNIGGRVDHLNGTRRQLHRGERENRSSLVQKLAEQVAEVRVVSGMLERLLLRPINLAMKEVSVADRAIGASRYAGSPPFRRNLHLSQTKLSGTSCRPTHFTWTPT